MYPTWRPAATKRVFGVFKFRYTTLFQHIASLPPWPIICGKDPKTVAANTPPQNDDEPGNQSNNMEQQPPIQPSPPPVKFVTRSIATEDVARAEPDHIEAVEAPPFSSLPPVSIMMPYSVRSFPRFSELPAEIREQIWGAPLKPPGIQFAELKTIPPPDAVRETDETEEDNEQEAEGEDAGSGATSAPAPAAAAAAADIAPEQTVAAPEGPKPWTGVLQPWYTSPAWDPSFSSTASAAMKTIASSCPEAQSVLERARTNRFALTMPSTSGAEGQGRLITSDVRKDLVFLRYADVEAYHTPSGLPPWLTQSNPSAGLACEPLKRIRHLALPYSNCWDEERNPCPRCGKVHNTVLVYRQPEHLVAFLGLFENLESFYLVDYRLVRKTDSERPTRKAPGGDKIWHEREHAMTGRSRVYTEASNMHEWKTCSNVFRTTQWLQEQYVSRANKRPNFTANKNPEKVSFGVVACEWTEKPPPQTAKLPFEYSVGARNREFSPKKRDDGEARPKQRRRRMSAGGGGARQRPALGNGGQRRASVEAAIEEEAVEPNPDGVEALKDGAPYSPRLGFDFTFQAPSRRRE